MLTGENFSQKIVESGTQGNHHAMQQSCPATDADRMPQMWAKKPLCKSMSFKPPKADKPGLYTFKRNTSDKDNGMYIRSRKKG